MVGQSGWGVHPLNWRMIVHPLGRSSGLVVRVGELCVVVFLLCVAELKMSTSWRRDVVCHGLRSMGAFDSVCIALMRSCAVRCNVSPGSIAGILVCFGIFFGDPDMRYPFVSGMKNL